MHVRNVLLFPGRGCAYVIYGRYERVLCMRGSSLNHASSVDDIITLKALTVSTNSTENITARSVFGSLHVLISSFVRHKFIYVSGTRAMRYEICTLLDRDYLYIHNYKCASKTNIHIHSFILRLRRVVAAFPRTTAI